MIKMTDKQAKNNCINLAIDTELLLETAIPIRKFGVNSLLDLLLRNHTAKNDLTPVITGVIKTEMLMKYFGNILVQRKEKR